MSKVNKDTVVTLSALEVSRKQAAQGIASGYGGLRKYAIQLNDTFPATKGGNVTHWFEVEHTFKDDFSNAVNTEKKAFYKDLREAFKDNEGETNPSVYWARIRKAGEEERLGKKAKEVAGEGSEGEEVNEGASGESNARSPMLRNVEELTRLYKFNSRTEALPKQVNEAQGFIIKALEALGVQINMIET